MKWKKIVCETKRNVNGVIGLNKSNLILCSGVNKYVQGSEGVSRIMNRKKVKEKACANMNLQLGDSCMLCFFECCWWWWWQHREIAQYTEWMWSGKKLFYLMTE